MTILYSCTSTPSGLRFVKWDSDMNPEATYDCEFKLAASGPKGDWMCTCPAGLRDSCKHRKMISRFMLANRHNTQWFHCYETNTWHMPFPTLGEGDATAEKAAQIEMFDASKAREIEGHQQPPKLVNILDNTMAALSVPPTVEPPPVTTTSIRRR